MTQSFNERFDTVTNGTTLTTGNTAFTNINNTSTTLTEDTSVSALGGGSAKIVQTVAFGTAVENTPTFGATNTAYFRTCIYMTALPAGGGGVLYCCSAFSASTIARWAIDSSGHFIIQNGTTTIATSTASLATSTWYRVEWDLVNTTATMRIYNSPSATSPVETISGTMTGSTFTLFHVGIVGSSNNTVATIWYDEMVIDSAATPGPVVQAASGTGSVVFAGTGTAAGSASASASVVITGTGTARGAASGSGSIVIVGSGDAGVTSTATASGTASIVIRGYGNAVPGLVAPKAAVTYSYYTFQCPTPRTVPPVGDDTPLEDYSPAIYFNDPIKVGENIFVDIFGVVSLQEPNDWSLVWMVYLGGHIYTITADEAARLAAAGFSSTLVVSTTPPVFNGGVGSPSGLAIGGPVSLPPSGGSGYGTGAYGEGAYGT